MFHINMSGDPEKGWHGEVHDGDNLTVHSPEGGTMADALHNLLHRHFGKQSELDESKVEPAKPAAVDQAKLQADQAAAKARMDAALAAAAAKKAADAKPV